MAKSRGVETDGHGIDGEVATVLIVLETAVFYNGLTTVALVGFLSGAHKFVFNVPVFKHSGTKGFENRNLQTSQLSSHFCSQLYAASYYLYVDVGTGAFQKQVPDVSTYDIGGKIIFVGNFCDDFKDGVVEVFLHPVLLLCILMESGGQI